MHRGAGKSKSSLMFPLDAGRQCVRQLHLFWKDLRAVRISMIEFLMIEFETIKEQKFVYES